MTYYCFVVLLTNLPFLKVELVAEPTSAPKLATIEPNEQPRDPDVNRHPFPL